VAEVRIRTITARKAASPGLGRSLSKRYGPERTEPTGKEDARSAAETARISDIKAVYAKEIAVQLGLVQALGVNQ
jgi:hypothetical protein